MPSHATNAKSALINGAVKLWHVVFLFFVAWSVAIVGSFEATQGIASPYRAGLRDVLLQLIFGAIIAAFTLVVPEFRRTVRALFTTPVPRPRSADLVLAFALALAWGYGAYRILICVPILLVHPDAAHALRFNDGLPPFEAKYLIALLGSVVVSPIAEELVFRGYLLNLWIGRRGLWSAIVLSSLVFGAFHLDAALFAAPMGALFALVYLRYDSLWPGILLHGAYNFLAFPWLIGRFFYVKPAESIIYISGWLPEVVATIAFVPLAIVFWRRFKPGP